MNNSSEEEKDKVTRLSIANMLYQGILGREIDNPGTRIFYNFLKENDFNSSIKLLSTSLVSSREFNLAIAPKMIVNTQFDGFKENDFNKNRTDEILMLQTSDSQKYTPIINASSKFNELYCKNNGIQYQKFIGLKRGIAPHHATLNRVFLLKELLDEGFSGWVLYLDADAIVANPAINIKGHFANLRENGKSAQLYSVDDDKNTYWNVNAGVLAIDLSTKFSSKLIQSWYLFYELLYQEKQYQEATTFWDEIINDQNSLHMILMNIGEKLVNEFCLLDKFLQNDFCKQFLRAGASIVPSEESIAIRANKILQFGSQKYNL